MRSNPPLPGTPNPPLPDTPTYLDVRTDGKMVCSGSKMEKSRPYQTVSTLRDLADTRDALVILAK